LVKDKIMLQCLRLKFAQNIQCRNVLLSTQDAILVEHTHRDRYWGDGGDGSGENKLGKLLMKVCF
jgi:N-glycosidase YbiA